MLKSYGRLNSYVKTDDKKPKLTKVAFNIVLMNDYKNITYKIC